MPSRTICSRFSRNWGSQPGSNSCSTPCPKITGATLQSLPCACRNRQTAIGDVTVRGRSGSDPASWISCEFLDAVIPLSKPAHRRYDVGGQQPMKNRRLSLSLIFLLFLLACPPGALAQEQKKPIAGLASIRQYISAGWDNLTRSM